MSTASDNDSLAAAVRRFIEKMKRLRRGLVPARIAAVTLLGALLISSSACATKIRSTGDIAKRSDSFTTVNQPAMRFNIAQPQDQTFAPLYLSKTQIEALTKSKQPVPTPTSLGIDTSTSQPLLLIVAPSEWKTSLKMDADDREEILFTTRERMYRYLLRAYPHPVRVRWAFDPRDPLLNGYRVVTVTSRITNVGTGESFSRYLVGYGLGATSVQVEGELLEGIEEKSLLGEYVVRARHGGYSQSGWNPDVFLASYCCKYAVDEAIANFTGELPAHLPGARPVPDAPNTRSIASRP
jgi:hypothetical protein